MDWGALRRIITENNEAGRSGVCIDGEAAKVLAVEDGGLAEIWTAALTGKSLMGAHDLLADEDVRLEPKPNHVKVRWFTVPGEDATQSDEERENAAAFAFAACGASTARVDTARHPMMHKTDTLDVIIVIKGAVDLLLDNGEAKNLNAGDVIIQQATNHAWVNHGDETAVLVAVLINVG